MDPPNAGFGEHDSDLMGLHEAVLVAAETVVMSIEASENARDISIL